MQIQAFTLSEDSLHIPKHLTPVSTLTGSARDSIDVENPTIRIEHTGANTFNYIYIPEFSRYYYVLDKIQIRTGITDIICHVDVLQSFYPQFIHSPMIASRSDSTYNPYIFDPERPMQQNSLHQYIRIGRFSDRLTAILVGIGGADVQ